MHSLSNVWDGQSLDTLMCVWWDRTVGWPVTRHSNVCMWWDRIVGWSVTLDILMCMWWDCIVVLACICLLTDDIEHLKISIFAISVAT